MNVITMRGTATLVPGAIDCAAVCCVVCMIVTGPRLRKLVDALDDGRMHEVYLFPKEFKSVTKASESVKDEKPEVVEGIEAPPEEGELAHDTYSTTYYIGLEVNKLKYAGGTIDLTSTLQFFKATSLIERCDPSLYGDIQSLGFVDATLTWNELPDSVSNLVRAPLLFLVRFSCASATGV
jgi:hypothetical protein